MIGETATFASLRLGGGLRRETALREKYRPEGYETAFDSETLWYDAVWQDGRVYLYCPPANNLRAELSRAEWRLDGAAVRPKKLRRYKRHLVIELPAPERPERVAISLGGWTGESAVSPPSNDLFAGLDCAFYLNRDNPLEWLRDHARHHRLQHGLQGLIVMDNRSETYGREDILSALEGTGLERVVVLDADFPYGPVGRKPYRRTEKFMQSALINVLHRRFLGQARGVLCCDVDELILSDGPTVFDAARRSRAGFVQIEGSWYYPAPGSEGPHGHADHVWVAEPRRRCPPKWCIDPTGPLGEMSRDVHGLERLPFLHRRTHPELHLVHCRHLSTFWKSAARAQIPHTVRKDLRAEAALAPLR